MLISNILKAVCALGIMGLVFGLILAAASKIFFVKEDDRKEKIIALLPGANCGGCGFAGCANYADAIINNGEKCNLCPGCSQESLNGICEIMGISASSVNKKVAVVKCRGNNEYATNKYIYYGINDCDAVERLLDGSLSCKYGCLGFGNCARECPTNAIKIENGVAVITKELCIGCGICQRACPKRIIKLVPETYHNYIACSNFDKGVIVKNSCSVGCIGCKICEKNCEIGAIKVIGNLAKVDHSICNGCGICADKCPKGVIIKTKAGIENEIKV